MQCSVVILYGLLALFVVRGVRDDERIGAIAVAQMEELSSCPEVQDHGYFVLLRRNGETYTIGDGEAGCIGTYSHVMEHCTSSTKNLIAKMENEYKESGLATVPWLQADVNQKLVVFKASPAMENHMNNIFGKDVNGITPPANFTEVFSAFAAAGCRAAVWGGEVRDAALGIDSMDTDVGWFCPQADVVNVLASQRWGGTFKAQSCPHDLPDNLVCKLRDGPNSYVQVGHPSVADEGFEGKSAFDNVLSSDKTREFSTNALAYDPMHAIVLDTTGSGLCDTLNKRAAFAGVAEEAGLIRVNAQNVTDFNAWKDASFKKMVRLLKLIIPPKSYCVGRKTFALVMTEIFSSFFPERERDAAAGLLALQHMLQAYESRSSYLWLYARELLVKFCVESEGGLEQYVPDSMRSEVSRASVMCEVMEDIRGHFTLKLPTTKPSETKSLGQQRRLFEKIQGSILCK